MKKRIFISTFPFADTDKTPLNLLKDSDIQYQINPLSRKLNELELASLSNNFDILIAGTELISTKVLRPDSKLKFISRVGIGLDGVNLPLARKLGIPVSYTPDAPAPAVAELTIGLMLSILRKIHTANSTMHNSQWIRYFGKRIGDISIGIIGFGRIGSRVLNLLLPFSPKNIMVFDTDKSKLMSIPKKNRALSLDELLVNSDLISIHIPLTAQNRGLLNANNLSSMKKGSYLVNTARGGIVSEPDLAELLKSGHLSGAAIDVFEEEPYSGLLNTLDNCLLTSHMGSMSLDCRSQMEIEATEEAIRFAQGKNLISLVPDSEYFAQEEGVMK